MCEAAVPEGYDGIYYLHDELPKFGQNIGNLHDVGELRRSMPSHHDERYCSKWVQFEFGEPPIGGAGSPQELNITSIYYHIWWKTVDENALIGYNSISTYGMKMHDYFLASSGDARSVLNGSGYWLTARRQDTSASVKDVHDFTIKVVNEFYFPSVISGPGHPSFIIINPKSDDVLKKSDSDDDTLSDYDEMYVHYTNPYHNDTDSDGILDAGEAIEGKTDPNNFDSDGDGLLDGEDPYPTTSRYRVKSGDLVVRASEKIQGEYLQIDGDIIVEAGGELSITNSSIRINMNGEQHQILVKKGGTLSILGSRLRTDSPRHWYSKTMDIAHWHEETNIDIFGNASIKDSVVEYGSEIHIEKGSNVELDGNGILYYRYGINILGANPTVTNNKITPYVGNGLLISHASPMLENNDIVSYIGSGIVLIESSPTIKGGLINGGSNDLFLTKDSHPILDGVIFPDDKNIEITDSLSEVTYAGEIENPVLPTTFKNTLAILFSLALIATIVIKYKLSRGNQGKK
jgi:hypothetical protein